MKLPKFFKIGCGAAEILTVKVGAFLLSKIVNMGLSLSARELSAYIGSFKTHSNLRKKKIKLCGFP